MDDQDINPASEESLREYRRAPLVRDDHAEGSFTRIVEQQAAKLPSSFFLVSAVGSMALSALYELRGNERMSRFVGMWAPTFLIMGVYNKIIKTLGTR